MKIKSLIVTVLCTVSIMCAAEAIQFSGNVKNDFNQYIANTPDKIKTFADIKNWCVEYKTKVPTAKVTVWTPAAVSCNTLCKTNLQIEIPALPAPLITTLISFISFLTTFKALIKPAQTTIAVPC